MVRYLLLFTLIAGLYGCSANIDSETSSKSSEKRIALTYDDAPMGQGVVFTGIERTQRLIAQLKSADTGPVAFFVTTRGLDESEGHARIKAYASAGHLIANHSHAHIGASTISAAAYMADIDKAEMKLQDFDNRRAWFRFPFLDEGGYGTEKESSERRDTLRDELENRKLMSGYVTVDTYDWYLDGLWRDAVKSEALIDQEALSQLYTEMVLEAANHYDRLALETLGRRPAQVLLLHENDLAAKFTADMVSALREDGWQIISPDEAFDDPIATQLPKTRSSGRGRIAALAVDKGLNREGILDHWSANREGIAMRAKEAQVFTITK